MIVVPHHQLQDLLPQGVGLALNAMVKNMKAHRINMPLHLLLEYDSHTITVVGQDAHIATLLQTIIIILAQAAWVQEDNKVFDTLCCRTNAWGLNTWENNVQLHNVTSGPCVFKY